MRNSEFERCAAGDRKAPPLGCPLYRRGEHCSPVNPSVAKRRHLPYEGEAWLLRLPFVGATRKKHASGMFLAKAGSNL